MRTLSTITGIIAILILGYAMVWLALYNEFMYMPFGISFLFTGVFIYSDRRASAQEHAYIHTSKPTDYA